MKELTDLLEPHAAAMDEAFRQGAQLALRRNQRPNASYDLLRAVRVQYGFKPTNSELLTPPSANAKLEKGVTPSYGLTLQHFRTKLRSGLSVNACPNAGHCVKVCVLNNGNGAYPAVQRAREAKTEFLVQHPVAFATVLGYELQWAARVKGEILFRPNVNSDVAWERLLPSLVNGHIAGVTSYGYSKRPEVLDTDGWLGAAYRVAYSWNETSLRPDVIDFLRRGGSVAVVTSRKKGAPVGEFFEPGVDTLDADKTDEWLFERGVVGDLSAKGKARKLIGKSGFVVTV